MGSASNRQDRSLAVPIALAVPVALAVAVYVVLRLALATTPGYGADVGQFKLWSLLAAEHGFARLYETSDYDYPPLYAYVLAGLGKVYGLFEPDALARRADSTLFTVLVKLPALVFDLVIAGLLVAIARASASRAGSLSAAAIAAAYLLNPAVLFDTGHWGQPDSIHSALVLAAFVAITSARPGGMPSAAAWSLLAAAALMKPLGAPYVPLLLVAGVLLRGARATLAGAAAAAVTALLVFLPFLIESGATGVARRVLRDLGVMGYTSVQAHNVWWLAGPWRNADAPWLGPVTAKQAGLALFVAFLAALCARAVRLQRTSRAGIGRAPLLALAGTLGFGFFMLSTHMHENHAFAAIPLLLGAIAAAPAGNAARRELGLLAGAISLGLLLNLAAHDPWLKERWPFALGGPSGYAADAPGRTFARGQQLAGTIGTLWNLLAFAALAAFTFGDGLRRLSWRPNAGWPRDAREA